MTTPITMQKALGQLSVDPYLPVNVVDVCIARVNQCLGSRDNMLKHRCDSEFGHMYQVRIDTIATPDDCLEIEQQFRDAGWVDVAVSFQHRRVTITLSCDKPHGWQSTYQGAFITRSEKPKLALVA